MDLNFTDLILLIGTNPLPNFVVAEYYLKKNTNCETLWLIHSEKKRNQHGTEEYAKSLKNLLDTRHKNRNINFNYVPLSDVSCSQKIENDIEKKLCEKISNTNIHLNYTGGTKAMCIHAYRTLEKKYGRKISFSYLDGRNYMLVVDEDCSSTDD